MQKITTALLRYQWNENKKYHSQNSLKILLKNGRYSGKIVTPKTLIYMTALFPDLETIDNIVQPIHIHLILTECTRWPFLFLQVCKQLDGLAQLKDTDNSTFELQILRK